MLTLTQMARGTKEVIHSGITATATSSYRESKSHNAMILYVDFTAGSGTWTIKIQGKMPDSVDTYIDMYDVNNNPMELTSITADRARLFVGIPDDFKIVATEDGDGATISVAYELISV